MRMRDGLLFTVLLVAMSLCLCHGAEAAEPLTDGALRGLTGEEKVWGENCNWDEWGYCGESFGCGLEVWDIGLVCLQQRANDGYGCASGWVDPGTTCDADVRPALFRKFGPVIPDEWENPGCPNGCPWAETEWGECEICGDIT
jgi:hypothetical protein